MFGVVPKTMWSKRIVPDEKNRITLAMRSLLIEHPDGLMLVETGLGNKEDQKFHDIYGVDNAGTNGGTRLDDAIVEAGHRAEDIRWVVNTHLHFDHAGGNTKVEKGGRGEGGKEGAGSLPARPPARLSFPNASYVVQANELEFARHTNERTRASYLAHNFEPVDQAGRWHLLEGETSILPGVSVRLTPGHVPWHQSVLIQDGGETLIYLGDIVPTHHHLPIVWAMGYDLEPLRVMETRRALLRQAAADGWLLCFGHDADVAVGRAVEEERGVGLRDEVRVGR
jgi:glyoxylase-like metal-dependent hydrolase (beta-lactamase superfamily II)